MSCSSAKGSGGFLFGWGGFLLRLDVEPPSAAGCVGAKILTTWLNGLVPDAKVAVCCVGLRR